MEAAITDQMERILSAINQDRWGQVDTLWGELLEDKPRPLAFHQPLIDKLARKQKHPEKLEQLYGKLLASQLERDFGQESLDVCEHVLLVTDKIEWLRLPLARALRITHVGALGDRIHAILDQCGFSDENVTIKKAHQKAMDLLGATKGQVFMHHAWGLGVVTELDSVGGKVLIDFQTKKAQQMTLDGVRGFLTRIQKDHILARMVVSPAELKEQCFNEPQEVIKLALRSYKGRMKVSDLKKVLTTRFLDENEYKKFWNASRQKIKLDPFIEQVGTGVHGELVLRAEARTFFDEIFTQFLTAKNEADRREVLREVRRHGNAAEMTEQDHEALFQLFLRPVADKSLNSTAALLNHGLLFEEFSDLFEGRQSPVDVSALLRGNNVDELFQSVKVPDLQRIALERIEGVFPESWDEHFAELMIHLDSRTAAWMEKKMRPGRGKLDERERRIAHSREVALENILARPDANPELFVWAARNILENNWPHLGEAVTPIMIIQEILSLMSELQDLLAGKEGEAAEDQKAQISKLRSLLSDNNSKYVKEACTGCDVEEARRVLHSIRLHDALSGQLKHHLESILIDKHTELRKVSRHEEEAERTKPTYHYTLKNSLNAQKVHLAQLADEVQQMAKVIEAARELGDLKENSEYHSAKDRQKLLAQQRAELEDLIGRARVVNPSEVNPESVRFGTRIKLQAAGTKEVREVTLLGMWETDVDNNIISYLTPFGRALEGKKVGERGTAPGMDGKATEYIVQEIHVAQAVLDARE